MRHCQMMAAALLLACLSSPPASAFCGFYVAKGDAKLFNHASQVVLVRNEDRTVITMVNDFKGDPKEFAVVVPVPTFLERDQIHIGDKAVVDHLDAYSAPRLVEYFDPDPCAEVMVSRKGLSFGAPMSAEVMSRGGGRALGVTIEATYTVGEYDILILSAKESRGLEIWLTENGYRVPAGASRVLGSYIRQNLRFFVAKVNLAEQSRLGFTYLRPLQVAYESPKFMLPIRLGTVNADGPQELFVYALTQNGRVETTNYRTVRLPSDADVPVFVKEEFAPFYRALFAHQVEVEGMRAVFLEYAWDMAWCDPCAADPLSRDELQSLGVFWQENDPAAIRMGRGGAQQVYVTRLHLRYDRAHFPSDLVFQETGDRSNFQARFVLRHPWKGKLDCQGADAYRRQLEQRRAKEIDNLVSLTGWERGAVRQKAAKYDNQGEPKWYQQIWKK